MLFRAPYHRKNDNYTTVRERWQRRAPLDFSTRVYVCNIIKLTEAIISVCCRNEHVKGGASVTMRWKMREEVCLTFCRSDVRFFFNRKPNSFGWSLDGIFVKGGGRFIWWSHFDIIIFKMFQVSLNCQTNTLCIYIRAPIKSTVAKCTVICSKGTNKWQAIQVFVLPVEYAMTMDILIWSMLYKGQQKTDHLLGLDIARLGWCGRCVAGSKTVNGY